MLHIDQFLHIEPEIEYKAAYELPKLDYGILHIEPEIEYKRLYNSETQ